MQYKRLTWWYATKLEMQIHIYDTVVDMVYMQQHHLQQVTRRDIYIMTITFVILYMNIICIAQARAVDRSVTICS